nr:TIGR02594 family protein [uncultured Albidiferax sp.]
MKPQPFITNSSTWMLVAASEQGVRTAPPGQSNPRITAYHAGTNIAGYDDKAAWCSSFVNWTLAQVGISGTGSALARSWLDWGQPLDAPVPGCIVVLTRDNPTGWTGHVGFYLRTEGEQVLLLGGNQLDCVCENSYPLASVLGYRWPVGVSPG